MVDFLLSPPVLPFSLALGLLTGLLALEILALLLGGSLLGSDSADADLDGADADLDGADALGVEVEAELAAPALPASLDLSQMELGGIDSTDLDLGEPAPAPAVSAAPGLASVLGLGRVPFLIWLAAVLAGFGLSGYLLQSLAAQLFGAPLPALVAVLPAGAVGLGFARLYGRTLARLIPGTESSVRSKAMLNRKRGVVSQGIARAGQPAEVRVSDAFGNLHYIRAEPLDQRESIAQGTEVMILMVRHGPARGQFRILPI